MTAFLVAKPIASVLQRKHLTLISLGVGYFSVALPHNISLSPVRMKLGGYKPAVARCGVSLFKKEYASSKAFAVPTVVIPLERTASQKGLVCSLSQNVGPEMRKLDTSKIRGPNPSDSSMGMVSDGLIRHGKKAPALAHCACPNVFQSAPVQNRAIVKPISLPHFIETLSVGLTIGPTCHQGRANERVTPLWLRASRLLARSESTCWCRGHEWF